MFFLNNFKKKKGYNPLAGAEHDNAPAPHTSTVADSQFVCYKCNCVFVYNPLKDGPRRTLLCSCESEQHPHFIETCYSCYRTARERS